MSARHREIAAKRWCVGVTAESRKKHATQKKATSEDRFFLDFLDETLSVLGDLGFTRTFRRTNTQPRFNQRKPL